MKEVLLVFKTHLDLGFTNFADGCAYQDPTNGNDENSYSAKRKS